MILIQMAMWAEARPLVERLGLRPAEPFPRLPFVSHEGEIARRPVALVLPGVDERHDVDLIGTQPATLLAHVAIERYRPRVLVNAGTCGAFASKGAAIGDVHLSEPPVVYHDRHIPIPGFDAYGVGSYPCVDARALAAELGLKTGVVSTGNALDLPEADLAQMRGAGASLKDMEAAAIAWVCALHAVDFLAVKGVTDLLDGGTPPEDEFVAHLRLASDRVAKGVERVVTRLAIADDEGFIGA